MVDQTEATETVTIDQVRALLVEHGYDVTPEGDGMLRVEDLECGVAVHAALEESILFCTVKLMSVKGKALTADHLRTMLAANNGISTSSFQLYDGPDGDVSITLNNFCKLLEMGDDDADDILSCLEFLVVDAYAAREILGDL